jgi:hypothetical protein
MSRSDQPRTDEWSRSEHLGDFDVDPRMLKIAAWAIPVGLVSAGLAFALLRLIGLITNLVFYQRASVGRRAKDAAGCGSRRWNGCDV